MESASIIASILDKLKLVESNLDGRAPNWNIAELRHLRTFFLCVRKWSYHESFFSSLSNPHELKMIFLNLQSSLCSVEKTLNRILESQLSTSKWDLYLREGNPSFIHEIRRVYSWSDYLLQSSCYPVPVGDELVKFIDSLVENLVDLVNFDDYLRSNKKANLELVDILKEKMAFLKIFIRLGMFRGIEQRQLERLLIHCEAVAVNAAHLSYLHWYEKDPAVLKGLSIKIHELLKKIKPVNPQVREMYIQVLIALKLQESSHSLITEAGKNMVGDFIDSLLGSLWELEDFDNSFMVSMKHQKLMLYEGLKFLRNIIKKQPEKFNGLRKETKDLFGAVVTDAGIIIFSLYMQEAGKDWAREMDLTLHNSLEKVKHIKAEIAEKCPLKSTFNFPAVTDELGFIDLLIENMKQLASGKVDSNSFPLDRYQKLQDDLVFLRAFLKNIVGQSKRDEKLQALQNRIIDVAYKVEFVIDSLIVGDTSYSPLILINNVIEEIEALEIDDNECVYKAQKDAQVSTQLSSKSTVSTTNEVVVGFEDEAREITDQLTRGSMQLDFVFILGMPGLGKTTLAHKVYQHPSILYHFYIRAWCTVSQVYCKKDLLLEILVCIDPEKSSEYSAMHEDDLAEKLYKRLKQNRYVIALDDVWEINAWNSLERSFPNDANGSRILLTSRIHNLALEIKPASKPLFLRQLTDDESWELLQKKLADTEVCHPALHDLGMRIAKGCKGVPLTIVIIAGILATLEKDGWEEIAERISSKVVSSAEQCRNILELSFRHLPDYLKPCFLYFGAFLEDEEIPVGRLMRLWIAEGFVQKNEQKSPEDTAKNYVMALIQRSLVMVAKQKSLGTVKTCRIHDLLYEFCLTKATEENFLQFVHDRNDLLNFGEPYNLRRVCFYHRNLMNPRHICPHVRSLLLLSQGVERYANLDFLLFIFRLKLLRVLDLGKVDLGNEFPDEIIMLVQLRYLDIVGKIMSIPPSIASLSKLETFRLMALMGTVLMPDTIWNMQMLRHLYVRGRWIDLSLAKHKLECSSHLYNLHTLATPMLFLGKTMEKIMRKFPYLHKLKCHIPAISAKGASDRVVVMDFLTQLESLKLFLDGVYHIDFLFPLNLKKLSLENFSWSIISTVGKLPNLEALKLNNASWLEIWEMKEGEFPKLKFLKLENLAIVRWVGSGEHFPCLEKLVLKRCYGLEELPSCLEYIPTLELIEVHRCSKSLSILVRKIEEEHMNMGNVDMKIIILLETWDFSSRLGSSKRKFCGVES